MPNIIHEYSMGCAKSFWITHSVKDCRAFLQHENFGYFRTAMNAVSMLGYNSQGLSYDTINELVSLARREARSVIGTELTSLFDKSVALRKEELWRGDELYRLFDYEWTPGYVVRCLKSALWVWHRMKFPVITVEDCIQVYRNIASTPYPTKVDADMKFPEKEVVYWGQISEFLFTGDIDSAYEYVFGPEEV